MMDKKRTTVTRIETQQIWIVRKVLPEVAEVGMRPPIEIPKRYLFCFIPTALLRRISVLPVAEPIHVDERSQSK